MNYQNNLSQQFVKILNRNLNNFSIAFKTNINNNLFYIDKTKIHFIIRICKEHISELKSKKLLILIHITYSQMYCHITVL